MKQHLLLQYLQNKVVIEVLISCKKPINKDSIKFTTDVQETEKLVYGSAENIAEGRLGFDDSKVGTFVTILKKMKLFTMVNYQTKIY